MMLAICALAVALCAPGADGKQTVATTARRFVDVSKACPRYFADETGKTWVPVGINMCYAHPDEATAVDLPEAEFLACYERWMRAFAANGGNFIRIFLCRPTVDVLTDKPGVWNERAAENLWKIVHLAEKLGIKIKFTMEVFRMIIPDAEATTDYKKKLNKSFYLPYAKDLHEFFHSPECERLFLDKARFYAARGFGDSPAVICWEPWNEIASTGPIADYAPWSARVQGEFRKIFPRQMVTQNLGSFSGMGAVHIYDQLGEAEPNDFMQVHRYLDPGAELDVCRGPMDVLCADAVRELLDRRDDKPALLAESGSVEKHHSGPSHLMALDKEGTMLHDALFAPFFAGAAGTGCNWHWALYVENNNLWHHFSRFRKAIEGLDPAAEAFRPFRSETHQLRIWGLKGRKTTVLWLRDKASDWHNELDKGIAARKLGGNKLPFVTETPARWYLPWEDREVETPAGALVAPAFRRSAVVRFPTDCNAQTRRDTTEKANDRESVSPCCANWDFGIMSAFGEIVSLE